MINAASSAREHVRQLGKRCRLQAQWVVGVYLGILLLGQIPVAGHWYDASSKTWVIILGWPITFVIGYLAAVNLQMRRTIVPPSTEGGAYAVNIATQIFVIIGALGALAVVYDFAVLRNYGFNTSAARIRFEEVVASIQGLSTDSPISGAGRLAIPAFVPGIVLAVSRWRELTRPTMAIVGASVLILLLEQLRFEGGRFFLTALGLCGVVSALLSPATPGQLRAFRMKPGLIIRIALLGTLLLSFFVYVFVARVLDREGFFWSSFVGYANNFYLDVDRTSIQRFDGMLGPLWFSVSMLWMYITQGLSEFDQIISLTHFNHAYGGYQFVQLTQISDLIFGTDLYYNRFINLPRSGTYITLPGCFYVDFGAVPAIFSGAVLGALAGKSAWALISGQLDAWALTGPIFLTISYFAGVISLFTNLWPALLWCLLMPMLQSQLGRK